MAAVEDAQAIGKPNRNQRLFECAILHQVIGALLEPPPSLLIDSAARLLRQHLRHNGLRALAEILGSCRLSFRGSS